MILIWGGRGWIGTMLTDSFAKAGHNARAAETRADDYAAVLEELNSVKPDRVVCDFLVKKCRPHPVVATPCRLPTRAELPSTPFNLCCLTPEVCEIETEPDPKHSCCSNTHHFLWRRLCHLVHASTSPHCSLYVIRCFRSYAWPWLLHD